MAKKKQRSVFWVVSTHIATTAFVMPVLAALIGNLLTKPLRPTDPLRAFLILLILQSLAYIAGVYYSLSYIRENSQIENPMACVKPSIITFVVLALVGFCLSIGDLFYRHHNVNAIVGVFSLTVCYSVICLVFARATKRGFSQMTASTTEA